MLASSAALPLFSRLCIGERLFGKMLMSLITSFSFAYFILCSFLLEDVGVFGFSFFSPLLLWFSSLLVFVGIMHHFV